MLLLSGLAGLLCFKAAAQPPVGEWRNHFSYRNATQVACASGKVYVVANNHLFSYSPQDRFIEEYSILNGLSGGQVQYIAQNDFSDCLLVVYTDGDMDILEDDRVINLPDYKEKSLPADKSIYQLRMNGRYAYLCTGVGVLIIDVHRQEILETYNLRTATVNYTAVLDFARLGEEYYMLTEQGIYRGNANDNLSDSQNWTALNFITGKAAAQLVSRKDSLYALVAGEGIYRYDGDWKAFYLSAAVKEISAQGDNLLALTTELPMVFAADNSLLTLHDSDVSGEYSLYEYDAQMQAGLKRMYGIALDEKNNRIYTTAGREGLLEWRYYPEAEAYIVSNSKILPNGPGVDTAWNLHFRNNDLYVSSGGRWGDRYRFTGDLMRFRDNSWSSLINRDSIEARTGYPFTDILNIAVDPADEGHIFATSWGEGLYEFRGGKLDSLHTYGNSPFLPAWAGLPYRYIRVDGAVYDAQGNLWVLNSAYPAYQETGSGGLHILLRESGEWFSPRYANLKPSPTLNNILFTQNNMVWINSEREGSGIFVLDYKSSIEDISDDQSRWISSFTDQDGINLNVFTVHCIVEDLNNRLWIGTNMGPLMLASYQSIFDESPVFYRVKIPRDDGTNEADYLLGNSRVYCIAVDGANRKWMGTRSDGLYLLSADGTETIHHFTEENSPLPSDEVWSVAIHPQSGEVFIGTAGGLVSYRSDALPASPDYSEVYAFPNPVHPGYRGKITVKGLTENSQVRITDLSGNLIVSGYSLGGQFGWDGNNVRGQRVSSGVYLVFAADNQGEKGVVCKIVVVN
ncbi:MAG: hypothetical protein PHF38_02835 [Bacteroidales bacterium]|nr:hypothetical protein [Bacteroidales bacterium]